jgi:predicted GIY-YIG superfamily endonuclease
MLYIGSTSDLRRRIVEHKKGVVFTTKKWKGEVELVYYEAYKIESDARDREHGLKNSGSVYTALKKRIRKSIE